MAAKKGFTWGAERAPTAVRMEKTIEAYLVDELDNADLGTVIGPRGEAYCIRVTVDLEDKEG
jgi:hypothetical protein